MSVALARLQAQHEAMDRRISGTETEVKELGVSLEVKHKENRLSIHALRGGQQDIIDLVHKIDLKLAKAAGYAMGAGAVVAVVVTLIEKLLK